MICIRHLEDLTIPKGQPCGTWVHRTGFACLFCTTLATHTSQRRIANCVNRASDLASLLASSCSQIAISTTEKIPESIGRFHQLLCTCEDYETTLTKLYSSRLKYSVLYRKELQLEYGLNNVYMLCNLFLYLIMHYYLDLFWCHFCKKPLYTTNPRDLTECFTRFRYFRR